MKVSAAGFTLKSGKKEKSYLCVFDFFADENRLFLSDLRAMSSTSSQSSDDELKAKLDELGVYDIVVDFPLSESHCASCKIRCPGHESCPVESVESIRKDIAESLKEDSKVYELSNKSYERLRVEGSGDILSKSLKRKFKKGYSPYYHRPIDYWIWMNFYDDLLRYFGQAYDSFGQTPKSSILKYDYYKRFLDSKTKFYEAHTGIILIEMLRKGLVPKTTLFEYNSVDASMLARRKILKAVEESFHIFIYEKDRALILEKPRAFDSFLLAFCGILFKTKKAKELACDDFNQSSFLLPTL